MEILNKQIQAQFDKMCASNKLFRVKISGDEIWELYLNSFSSEFDPIFRDPSSSTHNCNHCRNFIRRYGNIVAIIDNKIVSMFDVEADEEYSASMQAMNSKIVSSQVEEVFFETFNELNSLPYESCKKDNNVFRLGIEKNSKIYTKEEVEKYGKVVEGKVYSFNHFHLNVPSIFVDKSGKSVESIMGSFRDAKNVFQRAMETISLDTLELVRDLINQGSLLDGPTHIHKVEAMIKFKRQYDDLKSSEKDNWCWVTSYNNNYAKFKNELVGVLCTELAEGKELNEACIAWNKRVDPANYMKTTAPITKKQIEEAKRFVEENGYVESFDRRSATLDDIKAAEILHLSSNDGKIKSVSIFDNIKPTSTRHKRSEFKEVEEVSIEKFMKDILPSCTSVEAFLSNSNEGDLVTLTTAKNKDSKPIFKWGNNFSWTYKGNLAGKSQIKEAVKSRGGKIDAQVRVSIHFPDTTDDYDLHCIEPTSNHIYYSNRRNMHSSSGMLDLDAQGIDGKFPPEKRVENLTYSDISKIPNGVYNLYVNNYSSRGIHTAFDIEIEILGEVTTLRSHKTHDNKISIGTLTVKNKQVEFTPISCDVIDSVSISKETWGLNTNEFHKVNLVCLSPNHWGENNVGNKHYFFMLEGCKCPEKIRSFHNENLLPEVAAHRKVLEVLGNTSQIECGPNQLSGLGFNATVKNELIVKLSGTHKRVIKIKFNQ